MGTTGILVSERGLGSGSLQSQEDADAKVGLALERGVNLFDTADAYTSGKSETLLGGALRGRRDDVLIATKVRSRTFEGPNGEGLSRKHIIRSLEGSLRRLETDYVDLYQLHMWDGLTPIDETLAAMRTLIEQGKVRYIGVSNFSAWHLMKTLGTAALGNLPTIATQQIHYSPFTRDVEAELLPAAKSEGLGVLVWSPLAQGLLGGGIKSAEVAESDRVREWREPPVDDPARLAHVLAVLEGIAQDRNRSVPEVVLAWTLSNPVISSVLVGSRTPEQLERNLAEFVLDDAAHERIEQETRPALQYPYWHQAATVATRLSPADLILHGSRLERRS